jgi:hypothetical protein
MPGDAELSYNESITDNAGLSTMSYEQRRGNSHKWSFSHSLENDRGWMWRCEGAGLFTTNH